MLHCVTSVLTQCYNVRVISWNTHRMPRNNAISFYRTVNHDSALSKWTCIFTERITRQTFVILGRSAVDSSHFPKFRVNASECIPTWFLPFRAIFSGLPICLSNTYVEEITRKNATVAAQCSALRSYLCICNIQNSLTNRMDDRKYNWLIR